MNGWRRGVLSVFTAHCGTRSGGNLFTDEDGYTSVATAVALLVSISLVFSVAAVEWTIARSADVQPVADACAMAGENTVAKYCTIAQVVDASVLSMGLTGMAVLGAGLVAAAIPGAQAVSIKTISMGRDILRARQRFAKSAASGLHKLEGALPFLIVANSASCVSSNSSNSVSLVGAAVPFPQESRSRFSSIETELDGDEVADRAERLRDATRRMEEAKARADEARRIAWQADCVDSPSCLCSRAASLAGLGVEEVPRVDTPEAWGFSFPINRSRAYYERRFMNEAPQGSDIESITDSRAREAFYEYALGEVYSAYCMHEADGHVSLYVPHLARNSNEMRDTWLYWDARWPCTEEEEVGRTLHSTWSCPGARGEDAGTDSVAAVEEGAVRECPECRMSVHDLGAVASISTSATNGYEHYWQIIVDVAPMYQSARNEQADAELEMQRIAEEGDRAFEEALSRLGAPRPRLCPPGAWGCVAVVRRSAGTAVPSELTDAFLSASELPAGVAVAAAALAPDNATKGNDVLSHFFDGVGGSSGGSALGGVAGLWGRLLVAYGNRFEGLRGEVDGYVGSMDGLFGGTVGSWLRGRIVWVLGSLGLEPADMRMRKPALVGTDQVLRKAGIEPTGKLRSMVQSLPSQGSALEVAHALGCWVWDERGGVGDVLAELPIPGTSVSVPLTLDLGDL
ncbi:MAG: hypothetical protein IKG21_02730 [Atopobiaceae bacterium]|nr:hypothetical protein [Atopobiaceae bacterium]